MANIYNVLGTASTVGGLLSNALKKKGGAKGAWADQAKEIPQHIRDYGVQRDNLGIILCPIPKSLRKRYGNTGDRVYGVTRRTDAFNVPGINIPTSDVRRQSTGPSQRMPIGSINQSTLTISFLADQHGSYYRWMVAWMDSIVNFNDQREKERNMPNKFGASFYEVGYFEDYAVDLTLHELDEKYNSIIETTLIGAYPISISDKMINWNNSGVVNFTMEFAYTTTSTKIDLIGVLPPPPKANGPGIMGTLMKGLSIAQAVTSMRGKGGAANAVGLVAAGAAALGGLRR